MKNVLILGSGMVAGAHVRYLLGQAGFHVAVASRTLSKAQEIVGRHPRGVAVQLDSNDESAMENLIAQADLAVSLLPYAYHPTVAKYCVKHRVHMVTTSYVTDSMARLDGAARAAGIILLNEIGVDPGIDHMTAMRVIHSVQRGGGVITGFTSWCGGLPAPEANTNPFGYKFSWSPRGVLLAGKNSAHYLMDGEEISVRAGEIFDRTWTVPVEVEGRVIDFEGYPNRDSMPYMHAYGIEGTRTMFRGTLRYPGWCGTLRKIADLGLLSEEPRPDIAGPIFRRFTALLAGAPAMASAGELRAALAARLHVTPESKVIEDLAWLGLLSDDPLPPSAFAPIDILTARMLEKMSYAEGERDLLVLQHRFQAQYGGRAQRITSTMVDFGIPHGDTSMSRTVGLPAAIGVRLILEGRIRLTGVQTPVLPEIYEPVLAELETLGIRFVETSEVVAR